MINLPSSRAVTDKGVEKIPKRTKKAIELRKRVVAASIDLFAEQGYENTSVVEIADIAKISRRTFFRHFSSKEDLIFGWVEGLAEEVSADIHADDRSASPLEAMHHAMLKMATIFEGNSLHLKSITQILYDSPTLRGRHLFESLRWEEQWANTLQEKFPSQGENWLYYKILTATLMAAYIVAIRTWAESDEFTAPELIASAFETQNKIFSQYPL